MKKSYGIKIGGQLYNVEIAGIQDGVADLSVNGKSYQVEVVQKEDAPESTSGIKQPAPKPSRQERPAPATLSKGHNYSTGQAVQAPLPGVILSIEVAVGQNVRRGQKLAVLEAMKMENDIIAERDGVITAISIHRGDSVLEGETLMSIG